MAQRHWTTDIRERLELLAEDVEGTSLTEFVMGLPIMIMVMSGTISLYKLNTAGLQAKMEANAVAWDEAVSVQRDFSSMIYASPGVKDIGSITGGYDFSSFGGAFGDAAADPPGGVYVDSYVKAQIANTLFDLGLDDWNGPQLQVKKITKEGGKLAATVAMDDLYNAPNRGSVMSGILNVTGARLGLAAGVRYGYTTEKSEEKTVQLPGGAEYTFGEQYRLPFPTSATSKEIGMIVAYTELVNHPDGDGKKLYDKAILPFKMIPTFINPSHSGPGEAEIDESITECQEKIDESISDWEDCRDTWGALCGKPDKPSCGGNGQEGTDLLNCISGQAQTGGDPSSCNN